MSVVVMDADSGGVREDGASPVRAPRLSRRHVVCPACARVLRPAADAATHGCVCGEVVRVPQTAATPADAARLRWGVRGAYAEGSGAGRMALTASPEVLAAVRARARAEGVPAATWVRRVVLDALAAQAIAEGAVVALADAARAMAQEVG